MEKLKKNNQGCNFCFTAYWCHQKKAKNFNFSHSFKFNCIIRYSNYSIFCKYFDRAGIKLYIN